MRELRQHASRYLARVRAGETIEVTDRGRLVARIVPAREETWDDLVASGQIIPGDPSIDLNEIEPMVADFSATERLMRMREDER